MRPLRAAVVGAGHLGRFHAEKYAGMPGVELTAVVDIDLERATCVAASAGGIAFDDHRDLVDRVDLASVVVPTSLHYPVARDLLEAGIHVLVEKPFTASVDEGRDLIERSAQCGRVLQVGHIERFNPAIRALCERIEEPRFIEAYRIAPFNGRGTDVDVVLDLMIHDIDLMLQLVRSPIVQIDASGSPVLSGSVDIANARFRFANGCVANLTASRVGGKRERRIHVFQRDACFSADLGSRRLMRHHRRDGVAGPELASEFVDLEANDPLAAEIDAFVACVNQGGVPPVTGADGLLALQTACEVLCRIEAAPVRNASHG
jgi:predicted dehydrogenase